MEKSIYRDDEKKAITKLINQLKKGKISFWEVPEEYQNHPLMVKKERKCGIRRSNRRGYDVLRNLFFVEEIFTKPSTPEMAQTREITFPTFGEYYDFLNGDIYEKACYYQYDISKIMIKVDYDRLNNRKSFVENTINDYTVSLTNEEILRYDKGEQIQKQCKNWIDKFNNCSTPDELRKVEQNYRESKFLTELVGSLREPYKKYQQYRNFFMWQYIFSALNDKKRFNILMEYMSDYTCAESLVRQVCTVFNPDDVMAAYAFTGNSKQSMYRQKKRLKEMVAAIKNGLIDKSVTAFFDDVSHYYCEERTYVLQEDQTCRSEGMCRFSTYRYFETFESFIKYRNGDLTNCDLTKAIKLNYDFTKCKTDETTKLPLANMGNLNYIIKKKYSNDRFNVLQAWYSSNGVLLKHYSHTFDYFFDFVAFMQGDLSDADLLFCDGLENLRDFSGLDLTNAKLRSVVWDRLGVEYPLSVTSEEKSECFSPVLNNEIETSNYLEIHRESCPIEGIQPKKVYYISDLHLWHQCKNFDCKSAEDDVYILQQIVDNLLYEISWSGFWWNDVILIGGDTSSDFDLFQKFVRLLRKSINDAREKYQVIFLLGNHELWGFSDYSFEETVKKYEAVIHEQGMYLLQNELLYRGDDLVLHKITAEELMTLTKAEIRERTRTARLLIFGGLAFSGYNEEFNASDGIYRAALNRDQEIYESKEFEKLYHIVCEALYDRSVIVFTHTPQKDWCCDCNCQPGFVYVSGHTHRNYFYDDGDYRIYADNQIGYRKQMPALKYFYVDGEYDVLSDYEDGIHKITKEQYIDFYRGKNLPMQFNREINVLYMLKKNGYYCFVHSSKRGELTILNGGARQKLFVKDINGAAPPSMYK